MSDDLAHFRYWAGGNLVDNRNRGIFGEWLVGQALGVIEEGEIRQEWDAVDLRYGDLMIEVRTSRRSQTWNKEGSSTPRFGIRRQKRAWFADTGDWIVYDSPQRTADVYVFCLHQTVPATNDNVADPESWSFWVVATSAIDNELGDQKSIGIKKLDQLGNRIRWEEIRQALDNTKTG